ncbi:MAG TPA: peptidylprolyl isomerase [Pyrinomonadaceae bacterium]|jgi:cyclophilin family peptidyl-prolyl cis-trans isomerase/HEAT repeat protein
MKKIIIALFIALACFSASAFSQTPAATLVQIVKAEDERRFDKTLENLMKSANAQTRTRAALAAGRIGDEAAIPALAAALGNDKDSNVRVTAAFALGEIESIKGADAILKILRDAKTADAVRARAVEAAGKIAAGKFQSENDKKLGAAKTASEEKAEVLGDAILDTLETEDKRGAKQNRDVILLALTAALRVHPEETDFVVAKFLTNLDARVRAAAANTLTRIRAKNANEQLRAMLLSDDDAVARANAARALGAAADKESFSVLLDTALADEDARVRVSAMRALGNLGIIAVENLAGTKAVTELLKRGEKLLADFKQSKFASPSEKNELLEIATILGRIAPNTNNERTIRFLNDLRAADKYTSAETEIAFARVAPKTYVQSLMNVEETGFGQDWRAASAMFQGLGELAALETNAENDRIKSQARILFVQLIGNWLGENPKTKAVDAARFAIPDMIRAFAAFKSENTSNIFRPMLETEQDIFIRAAAAEVLGEQKPLKENVEALKKAFDSALLTDKKYNDAQLAILDALFKLDKKESVGTLLIALNAPDYLVRKKAFELLQTKDLEKDSPGIPALLENALAKKKNLVLPYTSAFGTKLGQILNTQADYTRAVSRKNGQTKAVLTTEKGTFTIDLLPEDAPLTVDNFIKLAKSGYFNGLPVHRVVPNFVMQDGDPRGDGNGGPGWEIRCELNMLSYERGAVGMALSGKDTGGSQWFVTHSPQPHLDGGYTIFGRVNETDMKIVDSIVRGDKILSVEIMEGKTPQKSAKTGKK